VAVDTPRGEYAFGEAVFTGTAHVIHDLFASIFDDGFAYAAGDVLQRFIPLDALPFSFTAFSRPLQGIENAIRIGDLV
jgi:hypothetical protein